jgi:hypothetical protein
MSVRQCVFGDRSPSRVPVKFHFLIERNGSELVPWELLDDVSEGPDEYDIGEDVGYFTHDLWTLPIEPENVECGQRFEVKGEGFILYFRCGEYGCETDCDYEGTLEMTPTDKEEIERDAE